MEYERIYKDMEAEVELVGALWHSHIGRRGEAVCAETSLGLLLHRDLQAGRVSASRITAVGLLGFNLFVAITILLRGYSSLVLSKPNLSWGSKSCSDAEIAESGHHYKTVSTESNCRSRGLRGRGTLGKQAGMRVWKPLGARKQDFYSIFLAPSQWPAS